MKPKPIGGIHHVTALASDPQRNVEFYTRILGFRLVKRTVNFDSPDVYHLYYGDATGRPGTLLTFFPFPHAARGTRGNGEIAAVALRVPPPSLDFWIRHLSRNGIVFEGPDRRFDDQVITFPDPDGMIVELVFSAATTTPWEGGPPREHAPDMIHGVTFWLEDPQETLDLLDDMGFTRGPIEGERVRLLAGSKGTTASVDIVTKSGLGRGRQSAGSVHHIAWRVAANQDQEEWRARILERGLNTTEVVERMYFRSVYFREPGGILFELATDGPGMLIDESPADLGRTLKLPPWFEDRREKIQNLLPPLDASVNITTKDDEK